MEEEGGGSLILFVYPIIFINDGVINNVMLMYTADTFSFTTNKKNSHNIKHFKEKIKAVVGLLLSVQHSTS